MINKAVNGNLLKLILYLFILAGLSSSCEKPAVEPTETFTCENEAPDNPSLHPKSKKFQSILDKYTEKGLPGISLLVEDSARTWVGSSGLADIEEGTPFNPCHVSKVASITKFMMGALIMKLQEEGLININDKISEYLPPEVIERVENAEKVSIRQCMTHTTGIYDVITDGEFYLSVLNDPTKKWEGMELIEFVYDKPSESNAGVPADYSNTNTLLLSLVIDEATGQDHAELLKDRVIDELDLQNTYYHHHDPLPSSIAQGYYDLYNNGSITNISNYITGNGNGYNGIYSNIYDLNKFLNALLVNKTFLEPSSLDTMLTFVPTNDVTLDYGPGTMRRFKDLGANYGLGHTGRDLGYSGDLFYFPNKGANMVFLVNYGTDAASSLKPVFLEFEDEIINAIIE